MMRKSLRIGLVQFLGSNCDQDCIEVMRDHFGVSVKTIWHEEENLPPLDGLILPGGFSYGDFLRSGALAAHTAIMGSVKDFVGRGGAVLGICNGFQILTESGILPGALIKNESGRFICETSTLEVASGKTLYHKILQRKHQASLKMPIAHGQGRYYAPKKDLERLVQNGQILFRYQNNPNGSYEDIAGVVSENGRVLGLMPHPERATEEKWGETADGLSVLNAFLEICGGAK